MRKLITFTAVVMAILCCFAMASCGGNSSSGDANSQSAQQAEVKTETWGNITVAVPDGMKLKGGSVLDEKDPDVVNISKEDNAMNYFLITISDDEDSAKSGIEATREANKGAADVSIDAGAKWTGVTYDFSGTDVMHIYATVDGRIATVQSYGFKSDDEVTKSVLSSLKVAAKK